jgi:hypothetical protein
MKLRQTANICGGSNWNCKAKSYLEAEVLHLPCYWLHEIHELEQNRKHYINIQCYWFNLIQHVIANQACDWDMPYNYQLTFLCNKIILGKLALFLNFWWHFINKCWVERWLGLDVFIQVPKPRIESQLLCQHRPISNTIRHAYVQHGCIAGVLSVRRAFMAFERLDL